MKNLILAVTLFCFLGHGCTAQEDESTRPGYANAQLKYLALGDSYTIGTAIGKDSAYAARLARKLVEDLRNPVDLKILAKNGWTTQDLLRGMTAEKPDSGYDLVTLLIGVNNQYQGKDLAHYSHDFTKLLHWAIMLAAGDSERVFVISIPDYGVTPAGRGQREAIAKDIDRFNQVAKAQAKSLGVTYLDITGISRQALNMPTLVADDGLHFSARMHRLWVEAYYDQFLANIKP